jgi:hypothetical protein
MPNAFATSNWVTNDKTDILFVDESELVRIYRRLEAKQRHKLMSFVFDMEEKAIALKKDALT